MSPLNLRAREKSKVDIACCRTFVKESAADLTDRKCYVRAALRSSPKSTTARLSSMRTETVPATPAVSAGGSALVVLEVLFDAEEDEELEVVEVLELKVELEVDELELVEDEDGVGLGLQVVEGGGGVQIEVGSGSGVQVVVGGGGGCQVLVGDGDGDGAGAGALPKDHVPVSTPLESGAKNWKRPWEKSRPA